MQKKKKLKEKRELDLGNKQKIIATVDKVKEVIPKTCKVCDEAVSVSGSRSGAVLIIRWNCANGHVDYWTLSEVLTVKNNQEVFVNNVQLPAAMLLSGNNFTMFELLSKFLGLGNISETLFYRVQLYCAPAIQNMWGKVKHAVQEYSPTNGVTIAGDGRNDSPGHSARYWRSQQKWWWISKWWISERLVVSQQQWRSWPLQDF